MFNLLSVAKVAKGGGADTLLPLLKSLGIDLAFQPVEGGTAVRGAFASLASSAASSGAKALELRGKMKNGETVHAVLVLSN